MLKRLVYPFLIISFSDNAINAVLKGSPHQQLRVAIYGNFRIIRRIKRVNRMLYDITYPIFYTRNIQAAPVSPLFRDSTVETICTRAPFIGSLFARDYNAARTSVRCVLRA